MTDLHSQVVLITGASSGIGAATARAFAPTGVKLVLAARRQDRLAALAGQLQQLGAETLIIPTDVSAEAERAALVAATMDRFGRIDHLFNNAGLGRINWLEALSPDEIREQFEVNILAMIMLTRTVLPIMQRQRSGHIINMASAAARIATPGYTVYAATKYAVEGFSEALRREVTPWGIQVSVIYPGGTSDTEFGEKAHVERRVMRSPAWLRVSADTVGQAVVRLARHPGRRVILPWPMALGAFVNRLAPWLLDWYTARVVRARRANDIASPG
jgi:short-subunit dehydrogenase